MQLLGLLSNDAELAAMNQKTLKQMGGQPYRRGGGGGGGGGAGGVRAQACVHHELACAL